MRFHKPPTILITCLLALAAAAPTPAFGQATGLRKALENKVLPKPDQPAPAEKPDETEARLQQWLKEARESLARLEDPSAESQVPQGITASDLEDRRRDTEQTILTITRYLKVLAGVKDAHQTLEAARAKDAAWTGFKEGPPYTILMIDELLNEQDAVQEKLSSSESSLLIFQRSLASALDEIKAAEEATRIAMVAADKANGTSDATKWKLDAARAKSRLFAVRASSIQSNCASLEELANAAKIEISLLTRQLKAATANSRFNDEDLAKINQITTDRKASLHKEIDAIQQRLKVAMAARKSAQSALESLQASAAKDPEPAGIDLAKFRVEVADTHVDSLQFIQETLEGLTQSTNLTLSAYQDRKAVIDAHSPADRQKSLQSLGNLLDRIHAWENVVNNEIVGVTADLGKLETRAASTTAQDPRFSLLAEQRAAISEKQSILQRMSQSLVYQRKLLTRWTDDFTPKNDQKSLIGKITSFWQANWGVIKNIWTFEVSRYEETFDVDGQISTKTHVVTLGLLLRAILFFTIAYLVFSKMARKIQRAIVAHGHIAEAQARTLRKWLMVVVNIFLAIATLSFIGIGITAFAYFGGALAIAIGFGTQTLIKNFISGVIVLFERKIRVGDIVDVQGVVGTISEINTRSSVVRGFDGVETMIPNSLFLEKHVTNWTLSNKRTRRTIRVTAAYGSPPQKVMEIMLECIERHGLVLKEPEPYAVLEDFGDNALAFAAYYWLELNDKTNANIVASDLRLMIDKRFREAGISIPFPQRELQITTAKPLQVEWAERPCADAMEDGGSGMEDNG
jgi:small-conductance mechanosensitive channel